TDISQGRVVIRRNGSEEVIAAQTILWAAGMKASALGQILAGRTGAKLDRAGRVMVEPDLTLAGQPDIFVIGDLAHYAHQTGNPLPGIAPVAIQQGQYVGAFIKRRLKGETSAPFHYFDKGTMAVIGRHAAVAVSGRFKFAGFPAWLAWAFIHLWYLIGFDTKLMVMFQWAWNYFTRKVGARLITGEDSFVLVKEDLAFDSPSRQALNHESLREVVK
ncbi:MAG TPA: FAD-dependent oxidoreductase, partial [Xanthomonadales bacterium]|nr:FAD-dependent oxidoreductase [Xanthomonadales bacterium]